MFTLLALATAACGNGQGSSSSVDPGSATGGSSGSSGGSSGPTNGSVATGTVKLTLKAN